MSFQRLIMRGWVENKGKSKRLISTLVRDSWDLVVQRKE